MTNITVYPHTAFRPGNEAIAVTTSASPGEILRSDSVLGRAVIGASKVLEIDIYPFKDAVVFEGSVPKIDERRERLAKKALELAGRALEKPHWESSTVPSKDALASLIQKFGAPYGDPEKDSLYSRLTHSLSDFADTTTHDGTLTHMRRRPYCPLSPELAALIREARTSQEEHSPELLSGVPEPLLEKLSWLARVDGLPAEAQVVTALKDYVRRRLADSDLPLKARAAEARKQARQ
ncbi:MAG: hypothetical protein Q4B05_03595 [Candidatus Saccharibacteria bacterium]|nr:hypothetical protein [Candidatus Saccharibacteria bacterium]